MTSEIRVYFQGVKAYLGLRLLNLPRSDLPSPLWTHCPALGTTQLEAPPKGSVLPKERVEGTTQRMAGSTSFAENACSWLDAVPPKRQVPGFFLCFFMFFMLFMGPEVAVAWCSFPDVDG